MPNVKSIIITLFTLGNIVCQVTAQPTHSAGFYIILDNNKRCASPFKYLHQKLLYCLSERPFVSDVDFEEISEIHYDTLKLSKYITLKLSKDAFERLHILTEKLPGISLVLVINETIIGSFQNSGIVSNPIPINSNLFSNDIEWIYDRLKKQANKK